MSAPGLKGGVVQAAMKISAELDYFSNMEAQMWKSKIYEQTVQNEKLFKNKITHGFKFWDVYDFKGMYHLNRIKSKFPIPGTQIAFEEAKQAAQLEKVNTMGKTIEQLEQGFRDSTKRRGRVHMELEQIKSASGERFRSIQSVHRYLDQQSTLTNKIIARHNREQKAMNEMSEIDPRILNEMFEAVRNRDFDTLKVMIVRGLGNINTTKPPYSNTLLMEACSLLSVSMVVFLLSNGADPDQANMIGDRPLHVCWRKYSKSRKKSNKVQTLADLQNTQAVVEALLEYEVNVNATNRAGETPLHLAARANCEGVCYLLLIAGAKADLRDNKGKLAIDHTETGQEANRMLSNWTAIKAVTQREEFIRLWTKRLRNPIHPSNIDVQKPVSQLLDEIDMVERGRQSSSLMRNGILVAAAALESKTLQANGGSDEANKGLEELRSHLEQVEQGTSNSTNGPDVDYGKQTEDTLSQMPWMQAVPLSTSLATNVGTENLAVNKKKAIPIAQRVRSAQVMYTAKYRSEIRSKRKRMKPSKQSLTLTEYLVGTEDRQKAEKKDRMIQRQQYIKVDNRRTRAALVVLQNQYKGNCQVAQGHIRPTTVSALGRPDGISRPSRQREAASQSMMFTRKGGTKLQHDKLEQIRRLEERKGMEELQARALQHRHTIVPGDIQAANAAAAMLSSQSGNVTSFNMKDVANLTPAKQQVPRDRFENRPSVLQLPGTQKPKVHRKLDIHVTPSEESKIKEHVQLLSQEVNLINAHAGVPGGHLRSRRVSNSSHDSVNVNGTTDPVELSKEQLAEIAKQERMQKIQARKKAEQAFRLRDDSVTTHQSVKDRIWEKHPINDPRVLPPKYLEHQLFTHVKRMQTVSAKAFTKIELLDAFSRVQASSCNEAQLIPGGFKDAILETVYARGPITIEQLFDEFSSFTIGKNEVDLRPALLAIADQLVATHKYTGIHPELLKYGDRIRQPPVARMAMRGKPIGDTWLNTDRTYKEKFGLDANSLQGCLQPVRRINKYVTLKMMGQL